MPKFEVDKCVHLAVYLVGGMINVIYKDYNTTRPARSHIRGRLNVVIQWAWGYHKRYLVLPPPLKDIEYA